MITPSAFLHLLVVAALMMLASNQPLDAADAQEQGELSFYDAATQTGVVARRVFRDASGRVVKTIYYRAGSRLSEKPLTEEEGLSQQSIVIREYGEDGRFTREKHFGPDMTLNRVMESAASTTTSTSIWRRADQSTQYEIRSVANQNACHLYFDNSGTNLVAVSGTVPVDKELAGGWGGAVDGVACGVGLNCSEGRLAGFILYVTVRNWTASPRKVITCLPYHEIQIELRDEAGNLVAQDVEHIRKRDQALIRMNRGINENTQTIGPHQAATFDGGRSLRDWYSDVPAGTYDLTVRRRGDGADFPLVSNPVRLQVVATEL